MSDYRKNNGLPNTKLSGKSLAVIAVLVLAGLTLYHWLGREKPPKHNENPTTTLTLHMIDVGQGDALLIETDGKYALVDAGPGAHEKDLISYLDGLGVKDIEFAVFTHPHEDHIGGADNVLKKYNVNRVLLPDAETSTAAFEKMLKEIDRKNIDTDTPQPGDNFTLGEAVFTVLSPMGDSYEGLNEYSIVLRLDFGRISMLLTGDAETVNEKEILSSRYSSLLKCDLLKVGHHGSVSSTSDAFLRKVSPDIAFISCGVDNDYGHPHDETIQKLADAGCKIYRTDYSGTVLAVSDGKTIRVQTEG